VNRFSNSLLSDLFLLPTFLEYEDCVFLAHGFTEENYNHWCTEFFSFGLVRLMNISDLIVR